MQDRDTLECCTHGAAYATYVCEHLVQESSYQWFSCEPDDDVQWPDSWCHLCHEHFLAEGEWNEKSEVAAGSPSTIKLLCHHCYLAKRAACEVHFI